MPDIKSADDYWAAQKRSVTLRKTASRTAVAQGWFSVFELAGDPGPGVLAGGQTSGNLTAGIVPTDATPGYPEIKPFNTSAIGRITALEFSSSVACRMRLFERLWVAGAYAFNANQTLTAQPSLASRLTMRNPVSDADLVDYTETEAWAEMVTAATGNQAVNLTYTDQDGNAGAVTGAQGIGAAPTVGRCWQIPLIGGDTGLQKIDNIAGSVASVGTFNVMILRPLATFRVKVPGDGDKWDASRTGAKQIFADSALYAMVCPDSTATGIFDLDIEISNK